MLGIVRGLLLTMFDGIIVDGVTAAEEAGAVAGAGAVAVACDAVAILCKVVIVVAEVFGGVVVALLDGALELDWLTVMDVVAVCTAVVVVADTDTDTEPPPPAVSIISSVEDGSGGDGDVVALLSQTTPPAPE